MIDHILYSHKTGQRRMLEQHIYKNIMEYYEKYYEKCSYQTK